MTRKRLLASIAAAVSAAACTSVFVSIAQAQDPGVGLASTTWDCTNGVQNYVATFDLPGAFFAPGPGALTAPFPGVLVAITPSGPELGLYQVLPPFENGLKSGLSSGVLSCEFVVDGTPVPPALNVAPAGQ
jgi:hypothetical protein